MLMIICSVNLIRVNAAVNIHGAVSEILVNHDDESATSKKVSTTCILLREWPVMGHLLYSLQHSIIVRELLRLQCSRRTFSQCVRRSQLQGLAGRGVALLRSRRLIELQGQDAARFLQGLTTANIPSVNPIQPNAIYSAFLNAQGRLLQDVFIYHMPLDSKLISSVSNQQSREEDQRFLIEVDHGQMSNLIKWLRAHKLRAKVTIGPIPPGEIDVISAWDDSMSFDETFQKPTFVGDEHSVVLQDTRAPGFGLRVLSREGHLPASLKKNQQFSAGDVQSEQQYTVRRYTYGIPEGENELAHKTALVHESNIDHMGGVDFQKGCYVGQELVIRTQHTGVVRKRILPCILYNSEESEPEAIEFGSNIVGSVTFGTEIKSPAKEGEKVKKGGTWLAGVGNVGIAICKLQDMVGIVPAGDIAKSWKTKEWVVHRTGDPEMEDLKVKAFVPAWWRER